MAALRLLILVQLLATLTIVRSDYVLSFGLNSFNDPNGEDIGGVCCDGTCPFGVCVCPSACDFYFFICVEPIHSGSTDPNQCSTGWKRTPVIKSNSDSVTFNQNQQYGDFHNPTSLNVAYSHWEGFNFKLKVKDSDDITADDEVDQFVVTFTASSYYVAGRTYVFTYNHPRTNARTTQ